MKNAFLYIFLWLMGLPVSVLLILWLLGVGFQG
jgi:hypothetical protein